MLKIMSSIQDNLTFDVDFSINFAVSFNYDRRMRQWQRVAKDERGKEFNCNSRKIESNELCSTETNTQEIHKKN